MRRGRLRPVNRERQAWKYERNFGVYSEWIRRQDCATCGKRAPSEASHVDARGMGGCGGDKWSLIPQCMDCHKEYEGGKKTYRTRLMVEKGIELRALPRFYQEKYERSGGFWKESPEGEW